MILDKSLLLLLNNKYISKSSQKKIDNLFSQLDNNNYYITSSLEEIAYLTNLRQDTSEENLDKILFDTFMIVGKNNSTLYTDSQANNNIYKHLKKYKIKIKLYDAFYNDLTCLRGKTFVLMKKSIIIIYI